MDFQMIKSKVSNRKPNPEGIYNRFSVLVPIVKVDDELQLLFEVRSENLKTQPREICFPGGRIEKNEEPKFCAVRETCEELGISSNQIEVFGPLDYLVTPFNMILYPYLGSISGDVTDLPFNRDEVSDIFTVPISFFMENEPLFHPIEMKTFVPEDFPYHMIADGENYTWKMGKYPVLFYRYNDYIIWGLTARIIKSFIEILTEED